MHQKIDIRPVNDMNGLTLLRVDATTQQVLHYERHPMNTYVLSHATDGSHLVSKTGAKRGKNKMQRLAALRIENEQRLREAGKTFLNHQDIHAHLRGDILRTYKNSLIEETPRPR